ncbi:hypothetical protein ACKFKF_08850 [Phormidesmis sp. 146-12]
MFINWYTSIAIALIVITVACLRISNSTRALAIAASFFNFAAKVIFIIFVVALLVLVIFKPSVYSDEIDLHSQHGTNITGVIKRDKSSVPDALISIIGSITSVLSSPSESIIFLSKIISRSVDSSPTTQVFHNIPGEMQVGIKEVIRAVASPRIDEDMLAKSQKLGEKLVNSNHEIHYDPRSVEMRLIADPESFKIFQIHTGKQFLVLGEVAEWIWEVTPLKVGDNLLTLQARVEFPIPELETPYLQQKDIFNERVSVRFNLSSLTWNLFIGNWKDLLSVSIVSWIAYRITEVLKVMSQAPKYDMRNSTIRSFIETNSGTNVQGDYIDMNHDLVQAAVQIQDLIEQLQKTGVTVDVARDQVAQDIATKAESNPKIKDKLIKWGQSLGDATVSDVVKGVVKLAIRSAGIPLP